MDVIDLRSDTVTTPTLLMRQAMAAAVVGDDGYGGDPTVARLEQRAAQCVGKSAGLFCPSGTMANLLALMVHTRPGGRVIVEAESHIAVQEREGVERLAQVRLDMLASEQGYWPLPLIREALETSTQVPATLLCLENPHNRAGGTVWDPVHLERVCQTAHRAGVLVHVDGARLFNAAVALHRSAESLVRDADSVMFCLSKGLAAPVGSMLLGSSAFISRARQYRKWLGGGMRQVGLMAAAGLVALDTMVSRLAEDHALARVLHAGLAPLAGLTVSSPVTNMVLVTVDATLMSGRVAQARLAQQGILVSQPALQRLRLVTHKDVRLEHCGRVIEAVKTLAGWT